MTSGRSPVDFSAQLTREGNAARCFLRVLESEQAALASGEVEALENLAAEKSRLAGELDDLAQSRDRLLAEHGLPAGRKGAEVWADADGSGATRRLWRELLELWTQAQRANRVNGALIDARLAHTRQALALLHTHAGRPALYGPDGHARVSGGGRPLQTA